MNDKEYYKMFEVEESHWWYVALHDLILYFVDQEHKKKGNLKILDAGCGTGYLCQFLSKFGKVMGCDYSELALELCRKRGLSSVFQADLNSVELGHNNYDVIISADVLYHREIKDDMHVLKKFSDALKPGGVLILNLPAFNFLRSHHDIAVHTKKRYTKPVLLQMVRKSGLNVEKISYRVGFLFILIAAFRLLQKLIIRYDHEKNVSSDVEMPSPIINKFLLWLNLLENFFIEKFSIPFGTSIFVVVRKPG